MTFAGAACALMMGVVKPRRRVNIKRAMEKTADRLGRGKSLLSQSQPALLPPGHRRMFSLTRGKGKEQQADGVSILPLVT